MKQFILLISFLTTGFLLQAQYINNAGFETWPNGSDPTGWQSPNSFTSGLGVTTVSKDVADYHSGLCAAKLETKSVFGYPVPGILTNGIINVNLSATPPASITGGVPFTQKPTFFKGYYKYTPATGDVCILRVNLLKRNGSAVDTIGYAQFSNTATINSWTLFEATFTYLSVENPDTMQVTIYSSNPLSAVVGSILKVDDLYLEGGMGINKINLWKSITVFPNPTSDLINIQFHNATKTQTTIAIYSLVGQKVSETILPTGTELSSINVRNLNKGMYFLYVQSGKEKFTQKISIE